MNMLSLSRFADFGLLVNLRTAKYFESKGLDVKYSATIDSYNQEGTVESIAPLFSRGIYFHVEMGESEWDDQPIVHVEDIPGVDYDDSSAVYEDGEGPNDFWLIDGGDLKDFGKKSTEEWVDFYKGKYGPYLPADFDFLAHICSAIGSCLS